MKPQEFDLDEFISDEYYQEILKRGLSYEPEEFLKSFEVDRLSDHPPYFEPLYAKYEDQYYAFFGAEYDVWLGLAIDKQAEFLIRNYDPNKLEDVRYDEHLRQILSKDAYGYYGVRRSDFY